MDRGKKILEKIYCKAFVFLLGTSTTFLFFLLIAIVVNRLADGPSPSEVLPKAVIGCGVIGFIYALRAKTQEVKDVFYRIFDVFK